MRPLTISLGQGVTNTHLTTMNASWDDIVTRLSQVERVDKTIDELKLLADSKDPKKDPYNEIKIAGRYIVGGKIKDGETRSNSSVEFRDLLTLDIDDNANDAIQHIRTLSCAYFLYSTFSHGVKGERYRLVVPLSRSVNKGEYETLTELLAQDLGVEIDNCSKTYSQPMFTPRCASDSDCELESAGGEFLDVDKVLEGVELREPSTLSRVDPADLGGYVGHFNSKYNIHEAIHEFLSDVYEPVGDKYRLIGSSSPPGLLVLDQGSYASSFHTSRDPVAKIRQVNAYQLVMTHKFKGDEDRMNKFCEEIGIDGLQGDFETGGPEAKFFARGLAGQAQKMRKDMLEAKYILGHMAILGQATVFFGPANSGKTLITLKLLTEAIHSEDIKASDVYYVNADDNHAGLVEKIEIAEEYGFEIMCPGYEGLTTEDLEDEIVEMAQLNQAKGVVIILDTLKKFCPIMDKPKSARFWSKMRQFTSRGGSVIALAHTNKHKDAEGKNVHAGTTDSLEDVDCAYILNAVKVDDNITDVTFINAKSRANVPSTVCYRYVKNEFHDESSNYLALLKSVKPVDKSVVDEEMNRAKLAEEAVIDAEVISAIIVELIDKSMSKTSLRDSVVSMTGKTRSQVVKVIEKYVGEDFDKGKRWVFKKEKKNFLEFSLNKETRRRVDAGEDLDFDGW